MDLQNLKSNFNQYVQDIKRHEKNKVKCTMITGNSFLVKANEDYTKK